MRSTAKPSCFASVWSVLDFVVYWADQRASLSMDILADDIEAKPTTKERAS